MEREEAEGEAARERGAAGTGPTGAGAQSGAVRPKLSLLILRCSFATDDE